MARRAGHVHGEHVTATGVTSASPAAPASRAFPSGAWPVAARHRSGRSCPLRRGQCHHAGYGLGQTMPPAELAAVMRYIREHREDGAPPLAVALEGRTDGAAADRGGAARRRLPPSRSHLVGGSAGLVALRPGRRDGQDPARPAAAELNMTQPAVPDSANWQRRWTDPRRSGDPRPAPTGEGCVEIGYSLAPSARGRASALPRWPPSSGDWRRSRESGGLPRSPVPRTPPPGSCSNARGSTSRIRFDDRHVSQARIVARVPSASELT